MRGDITMPTQLRRPNQPRSRGRLPRFVTWKIMTG